MDIDNVEQVSVVIPRVDKQTVISEDFTLFFKAFETTGKELTNILLTTTEGEPRRFTEPSMAKRFMKRPRR